MRARLEMITMVGDEEAAAKASARMPFRHDAAARFFLVLRGQRLRIEAIGWVLARSRERPAHAKLSERARELDDLKARF